MELDETTGSVTLEEIQAEMSERGSLEFELAAQRATNKKLRSALAAAINAGNQPPAAPPAA